MNRLRTINTLAVAAVFTSVPVTLQAASLLEVYQQALQSDPLIHEAESRRLAALEAAPQARGVLFPQLSGGAQWTHSTFEGTNVEGGAGGGVASVAAESTTDASGWQLQLSQSIFRWDQWVNLQQAEKRVAQAEIDYELAQQDLIIRVAARYFDVLGAEDRLTSINADKRAIARQLEQARQRFEVGLIAITDVQESQAAYDQAVANEIAAKRDLATTRELLREVTGEYVPALAAPGAQFPLRSPDPADQSSWVDIAMEQNLALVSSRFDEEIARDEISFRRTGHYPTVELTANLRHSESDVTDQIRNNVAFPDLTAENDNSSIGIQVNVPLFSGGVVSSQVREAVYLHRASREQLQRVARETQRAARDAYLGVHSEISRVRALEQAVESSRTALEATQAGFEVGTRTIVDVLDSQFQLYAAITNYYQSRYDYIANVLLLKQAAGTLRIQDLEEIDRWLNERRPPEEVIAEQEEFGTEIGEDAENGQDEGNQGGDGNPNP